MRHNNETNGQAFLDACRTMHHLMNSCKLWIDVTLQMPTEALRLEQGCLRSIRLARLRPVTHEPTAQSALQFVVLPRNFDFVKPMGTNHPEWQLMIYSWLGTEQTRRLRAELKARYDLRHCTFMLVHAHGCELLNS